VIAYWHGRWVGHCEEPFDAACDVAQDRLPLRGSDEALQTGAGATVALDCFTPLAMTEGWVGFEDKRLA
jgi:hypothetical protein